MEFETTSVTLSKVTLECFVAGEGDRCAILLHGFPDDAGSMRGLMERLVPLGYRCCAPYLRGYGPSGQSPDGCYRIEELAGDIIELARAMADRPVTLIGHDWGAVIAYIAATYGAESFDRLVTMAVPPPLVFERSLRRHRKQIRRSWYAFFFQLRGIADWWVRRRNFQFIDYLWRTWSPGWDYDEARILEVKATLASPGSLKAALAYYRQNISLRPTEHEPIPVPALVMTGRNDGCIGAEIYEDLDRAFSAPVRLEVVEGAGHFLHLEQPETVFKEIRAFLEDSRVPPDRS